MILGELERTSRGFEIVKLTDAYLVECSIQQSSAIGDLEDDIRKPGSSFLWIGVDDPEPKVMKSQASSVGLCVPAGEEVSGWMPYPIPPQVSLSTRMHLERDQVAGLVKRLQAWLETGSLEVADVPVSSIPPYQQRVIDEKCQLDTRLQALRKFIGGNGVFEDLHENEQQRLRHQVDAMAQYSFILAERIENFPLV